MHCASSMRLGYLHLGVEDAGRSLHNRSRAAVGLNLEDLALVVGDDGREVEDDILGGHVQGKGIRHNVLLAGGDLDAIAKPRQVADDGDRLGGALGQRLGGLEVSADKGNVDRAFLLVGDLDQGLGGATVDELDTKDVGLGEGRLNVELEVGDRRSLALDGLLPIGSARRLGMSGMNCRGTYRDLGFGRKDGDSAQSHKAQRRPLETDHDAV